jgi:hypothetical protein
LTLAQHQKQRQSESVVLLDTSSVDLLSYYQRLGNDKLYAIAYLDKAPNAADAADAGDAGSNWYQNLQDSATEKKQEGRKRRRGGYKPDKYDYATFDRIFQCTEWYCGNDHYDENTRVEDAIESCAKILLRYARRRQMNDQRRWTCFVSHPHPDHPDSLSRL